MRTYPVFGRIHVIAASLVFLAWAAAAHASGTYIPSNLGPPRSIHPEEFQLGKEIYFGRSELGAPSRSLTKDQRPVLVDLQSQLPQPAASRTNLPKLAGRLDHLQFRALLYYLKMRYKISPHEAGTH